MLLDPWVGTGLEGRKLNAAPPGGGLQAFWMIFSIVLCRDVDVARASMGGYTYAWYLTRQDLDRDFGPQRYIDRV